ncbi:hypothetical protein GOZ97_14745 [Agrobacterium vitis]|uniref:hypothetical protein n=1 Tax=Agrobacterium vitis TaxID=373 RepID=UPI0012E8B15E|nr:hypothetical protein [Agrobacterium vitis]MUZ92687.1 hypothetical protein [Agrobacterium vitis]MVA40446.1 hypothetical protein [Agrobacterium vitis]
MADNLQSEDNAVAEVHSKSFHRLQGLLKGETNGRVLSIEEINEAIIDGCLAANHPNLPRTTRINTLAPTSINTSGKS